MALKGIIFDFDGLIIDTEMPCCIAWMELFNQYGLEFTFEDYRKIIGTDLNVYDPSKHLSELIKGSESPEVLLAQNRNRRLQLLESQPILPGVKEFILEAVRLGIPLAIASSSNRSWIAGYLTKLELSNYFEIICTADDVNNVKPDPELFLLALERLKIKASEAIIFEDSEHGVKAANAAGIPCIAVPSELTKTMDLSLASRIVNSFLELDPQELINSNN